MAKSILDPLGSSGHAGSPVRPLLDALGLARPDGAGGSFVNEYLRLWLMSLVPQAKSLSLDARGLEEAMPALLRLLPPRTAAEAAGPLAGGREEAALAANLEHLARELASGDLGKAADVIKRLHAARVATTPGDRGPTAGAASGDAAPPAKEAVETQRSGESAYDQARRHLLEQEEEDRRRAWLTDRILDQLRTPAQPSSPPVPAPSAGLLQSEVRLSCPVNGRAAGRFRVANATGFDLEIELRAGPVQGVPPGWERRLPILFDEAAGRLAAGQERVARIAVDVAGCPLRPGAELELAVDVLGGGRLLHKVWVSIQVTSGD